MNLQDLFVGTVSAITGGLAVAAGVGNWEACFQLAKVQWMVGRAGRPATRAVFISGGIFFMVLGVAIACGFALNKPSPKASVRHAAHPGR